MIDEPFFSLGTLHPTVVGSDDLIGSCFNDAAVIDHEEIPSSTGGSRNDFNSMTLDESLTFLPFVFSQIKEKPCLWKLSLLPSKLMKSHP